MEVNVGIPQFVEWLSQSEPLCAELNLIYQAVSDKSRHLHLDYSKFNIFINPFFSREVSSSCGIIQHCLIKTA